MVTAVRTRVVAGGMLRANTPVEHYPELGLWVKREDMACRPPGPAFSKTRGVYVHVASRPEELIGVLDTYHSQAGHAVARACQILGKRCVNYYPEFKHEPGPRTPQLAAQALGAKLVPLKAGRSAILYHQAKKLTVVAGGYMMPNALKLAESVVETAKEVPPDPFDVVLVPASSGTIAAGVIKGYADLGMLPHTIVHLGYQRSHEEVLRYLNVAAGISATVELVDEGYAYKDTAAPGPTPPWPCNAYYDLKAFRWYMANRERFTGQRVLFWNVG